MLRPDLVPACIRSSRYGYCTWNSTRMMGFNILIRGLDRHVEISDLVRHVTSLLWFSMYDSMHQTLLHCHNAIQPSSVLRDGTFPTLPHVEATLASFATRWKPSGADAEVTFSFGYRALSFTKDAGLRCTQPRGVRTELSFARTFMLEACQRLTGSVQRTRRTRATRQTDV